MSKHTKGPWHRRARMIVGNETTKSEGITGRVVCSVGEYWADDEEAKANARLIAAAPELLEAAKNSLQQLKMFQHAACYVGSLETSNEIVEKLKELITKAGGE